MSGTGAVNEKVPPLALVPYHRSVAPLAAVAVRADKDTPRQNDSDDGALGAEGVPLMVTVSGERALSQPFRD